MQIPDGEIIIGVSEIILHPQFNIDTADFDLALMRLSSPVKISPTVNFACLPTSNYQPSASIPLTISGWGFESYMWPPTGNTSSNLKSAQVFRWPQDQCIEAYKERNITVPKTMLCAAAPNSEGGICFGDAGGDSSNC